VERFESKESNILIEAKSISLGKNVSFGKNIDIKINGDFKIGSYSRLGNNCQIRGNNISIGEYLYNSNSLRVGGGGHDYPTSNLSIGNRCTIHNNFLNVCKSIDIGDDVGLSPEVSFITHGFWMSVFEGNPAKFEPIKIGSKVIIGYRSIIMIGVNICDDVVIGAHSNVTGSINYSGIHGGNPCKFIKKLEKPNLKKRKNIANNIIKEYIDIGTFHSVKGLETLKLNYPFLYFKGIIINLEEISFQGEEDKDTDDLRDFLRKWGIRLYSPRGFISRKP